MKYIYNPITISSTVSNGIIYISDPIPDKEKEQELILLFKKHEYENDFTRLLITLDPIENMGNTIKQLSKKKY